MNRSLSLCAVTTLLLACDPAAEEEIEELEPAGLLAMGAYYCDPEHTGHECDPSKSVYLYEYDRVSVNSYVLLTSTYWVCDQNGTWQPGG
jgi:hypothetical protein